MKKLPLLYYQRKKFGDNIFQDYVILSVFHLLRDSIQFFEALTHMGACNEDVYIIGIPYSNKKDSVKKLKNKGYNVFTPNFPIEKTILHIIEESCICCTNKNKSLLIIEDGGYIIPMIHQFDELLHNVIGAVEQTARGVWNDKNVDLKVPVLTVAFSEFKKELEAPEVGKAVVINIRQLLSERTFLRGKKVGVMGFGTIGKNVAQCLKDLGAIVKISEIDIKKAIIAQLSGFEHLDSKSLIKECDIIIGTTGRKSIGLNEILAAKNNTIFVSASSKQIEIDMDSLERLSMSKEVLSIGTEYKLVNKNKVLVLANGFPVNFYCSESVPDRLIDFILSEILECAFKLATEKFPAGIHEDCIDEKALAEIFYKIHFG
ncbi:MAG: NAD(P)-dependent oxidoreductase [Candidatus Methanofastidiosia archaeon]|jgi:adenosylhomocysteinase